MSLPVTLANRLMTALVAAAYVAFAVRVVREHRYIDHVERMQAHDWAAYRRRRRWLAREGRRP